MLFAATCTTLAKATGLVEIPRLELKQWARQILPVGLCFALSLALGNAAYLYISVAFVQMLKASTPVAVLLCSFAFGLEKPTLRLGGFIVLISSGIATSCANELQISVPGVAIQMGAVFAEAVRLCLVNLLLTAKGLKLSSLATLHYVAPACAVCLFPPWLYLEGVPLMHHAFGPVRRVGVPLLLLNASVVVLLNLSTMALIKHTSALTLNVAGVFKDIGLIVWSVAVSGAVVTRLQYLGYGIALVGVTYRRRASNPGLQPAGLRCAPPRAAAAGATRSTSARSRPPRRSSSSSRRARSRRRCRASARAAPTALRSPPPR